MGTLALNRFRFEERLGSGAFGTVHRAWDLKLHRHVAVKAIEIDNDDARVLREAQAAARLSHPGIVALYELGSEGGTAYLVTELVEGESLKQAIEAGRLSDRDVAEVGAELCEALDHAHSRGVIHRDLKPANVQLAADGGLPKLMDFGVARLGDEAGLTATGDVIGTLAYMSPEQAEGQAVGPESDIYSLCLVLFEAWTGENPNRRRTAAATVRAIGATVRPLAELRPDLPARLTDAIDGGLDPEPQFRPSLELIGTALEGSLPQLSARLQRPAPRARMRLPRIESMTRARVRLPWLALLLLCLALLALPLGQPGPALLLALPLLSVALLSRSGGPAVLIPLLVLPLALLGLATAYPALCGLARHWRDRVLLALSGCLGLALAQAASGNDLGLGSPPTVNPGWQDSTSVAMSELVLPALTEPGLPAAAAIWVAAALLSGLLLAPLRVWTGRRPIFRRIDDGATSVEPDPRTPLSRTR